MVATIAYLWNWPELVPSQHIPVDSNRGMVPAVDGWTVVDSSNVVVDGVSTVPVLSFSSISPSVGTTFGSVLVTRGFSVICLVKMVDLACMVGGGDLVSSRLVCVVTIGPSVVAIVSTGIQNIIVFFLESPRIIQTNYTCLTLNAYVRPINLEND